MQSRPDPSKAKRTTTKTGAHSPRSFSCQVGLEGNGYDTLIVKGSEDQTLAVSFSKKFVLVIPWRIVVSRALGKRKGKKNDVSKQRHIRLVIGFISLISPHKNPLPRNHGENAPASAAQHRGRHRWGRAAPAGPGSDRGAQRRHQHAVLRPSGRRLPEGVRGDQPGRSLRLRQGHLQQRGVPRGDSDAPGVLPGVGAPPYELPAVVRQGAVLVREAAAAEPLDQAWVWPGIPGVRLPLRSGAPPQGPRLVPAGGLRRGKPRPAKEEEQGEPEAASGHDRRHPRQFRRYGGAALSEAPDQLHLIDWVFAPAGCAPESLPSLGGGQEEGKKQVRAPNILILDGRFVRPSTALHKTRWFDFRLVSVCQ